MQAHKFSVIGFFVSWIAKLLYFAALTSLIPFGAMLFTARPEKIPEAIAYFPITALGLIALSIVVLLIYTKSFAHTLASMGWMTLLPGIGALVFMFVDKQAVIGIFAKVILGFDKIEPYVSAYLDDVLPKVWIFIIAYILLGLVLISIAGKMEYEHALMFQFKKIFGPNARIFRR